MIRDFFTRRLILAGETCLFYLVTLIVLQVSKREPFVRILSQAV